MRGKGNERGRKEMREGGKRKYTCTSICNIVVFKKRES